MKNKTLLSTAILFFTGSYLFAQVPGVRWNKNIVSIVNPNFGQGFYDIRPTSDNGFICVGADSTFYESSPLYPDKLSGGRPWIIKLDSTGERIWKNSSLSDSYASAYTSVTETPDGGFVTVGYAGLTGIPPLDSAQVLIAKYNSSGALLWQKRYGGNGVDYAFNVFKTKTNGFIVAATTSSNNGDVTGNKGGTDVWLLRLDDNGNIIWKKCFGGSLDEYGYAVTQLSDYSFIVAGFSRSSNGDLTANLGNRDGWIFKTDSTGNLQWQKNYGGTGDDVLMSVAANPDGSIVFAGTASPTALITNGTKLLKNLWLLKVNASGNQVWSKAFGGSGNDWGFSVVRTIDNEYLVTGSVESQDGDVEGNNGLRDAWLLKVNDNSNLVWQKCVGTVRNNHGMAGLALTEYDFAIGGAADNFGLSVGLLARLGNSNLIKGTVFLDANSNGIKDAGELNFNNTLVKTQKGSTVITGQPQNGTFKFDIDTGTYTTTLQLFNPYYTVVPSSKNTSFTTYFNIDSFGLAVQPIPNQQDLIVHLIPATPARPGFQSSYVLNYKNIGTTTIVSGAVKFIKDSRTSFFAGFPSPASIVADTITWNYFNLQPMDSVTIAIQLQLAAPPALNINDTLKFAAVVLPVAGDLTPADDTSNLRQRVRGSYDPNDKQESFAGRIPLKNVQDGAYVNYVIRFQNTGNDTAFFVRLLDTLDAKLDWNSFQMVGSSHAYNLTVKDGNKLNWFFDNIKLPDSTTNLLKSNGYVAFRIKPKNNLLANDVISNKASIYFDYNLPIVTNTANTLVFVETTTGVRNVQNNEMKLVLGPNPANGYSLLQISGKLTGKFELRVIDNNGRIILQQTLTKNSIAETLQLPLNMQQFSPGVYYIQLQQKEKNWWQKVVVQ